MIYTQNKMCNDFLLYFCSVKIKARMICDNTAQN